MNRPAKRATPSVDQPHDAARRLQKNRPDAAGANPPAPPASPAGPAAGGSGSVPGSGAKPARPGSWRFAPAAAALSGSAIREILKLTEQPEILSFAGGLPNPAAFPVAAVRAASQRILSDDAAGALQYGPTEGYGPLREQVATRLQRAGQDCSSANVLITTGSQQALDLIGKALLTPGAGVLAANPSYLGALQAFALHQPQVDELAAIGRVPAAFCYLTPNFANPTGETLSQPLRHQLIEDLATADLPLIEDDPYGELWFDAPPPVACRALAPERVLHLGSFSKVLTPGLRVGYVAGPVAVIELLTRLKQAADLHTPGLNQRLVAALIEDGTLDAQLPHLRRLYRAQRDALMAALDRHFRPYADWNQPAGGMFAWLTLKGGLKADALFVAALRQRVAFVPGAPFYFATADSRTLRLAFSTLPPPDIDLGIRRLAAAAQEILASGPGSAP